MSGLIAKILLCVFGAVFTGLIGFWMGIVTERHKQILSKTLEEKLKVLPIVEHLIENVENHQSPIMVRDEAIKLEPNYRRLKVIVKGAELKHLNDTWGTLRNTTTEEMLICGTTGYFAISEPVDAEKFHSEIKKVRQLLISRMEAFQKAVEKL